MHTMDYVVTAVFKQSDRSKMPAAKNIRMRKRVTRVLRFSGTDLDKALPSLNIKLLFSS